MTRNSAAEISRQRASASDTPCASTFRSTVNNLNTEWLMAVRADYDISSKDRVYFRYNTDHGVQATGTDPINSAFNANSVQPHMAGSSATPGCSAQPW